MKPVIPITYQPNLVQPIPEVLDHKDYNEYRKLLERIDEILTISKLDLDFAGDYLELKTKNRKRPLSSKSRCRIIEEGVIIFRCNLIKIMTGASFRELSILVADSFLIRHFARLSSLSNHLKAPSKSLLHRYSKYFTKEMVDSKIHTLLASAGSIKNPLRLEKPLEVDDIFVDSTCIKANIHFPVDWLLVKDCAYTLIQSIAVIRKHGMNYPTPQGALGSSLSLEVPTQNAEEPKNMLHTTHNNRPHFINVYKMHLAFARCTHN